MVTAKRARGGRLNNFKYIIWAPWLAVIVLAAVQAGGVRSVNVLYQTEYGISVAESQAYIVYYFFTALIVILALTAGKRSFCHYTCWMAPFMIAGTKLRRLGNWPALRLQVQGGVCTGCGACDKKCPMSLEVAAMVGLGSLDNPECILCGECVDGCPKGAVKFAFSGGRSKAPAPEIRV